MKESISSENFRKARQQRRHSRKVVYDITGVPEMKEKSISAQYMEFFISNGDITIGTKLMFSNVTPAEINNYREHFNALRQMYGDAVSTSTYIDGIEVVQYYPQDVKETDYSKEPLTFKILSYGTINWTTSDSSLTKTIEYKSRFNEGRVCED